MRTLSRPPRPIISAPDEHQDNSFESGIYYRSPNIDPSKYSVLDALTAIEKHKRVPAATADIMLARICTFYQTWRTVQAGTESPVVGTMPTLEFLVSAIIKKIKMVGKDVDFIKLFDALLWLWGNHPIQTQDLVAIHPDGRHVWLINGMNRLKKGDIPYQDLSEAPLTTSGYWVIPNTLFEKLASGDYKGRDEYNTETVTPEEQDELYAIMDIDNVLQNRIMTALSISRVLLQEYVIVAKAIMPLLLGLGIMINTSPKEQPRIRTQIITPFQHNFKKREDVPVLVSVTNNPFEVIIENDGLDTYAFMAGIEPEDSITQLSGGRRMELGYLGLTYVEIARDDDRWKAAAGNDLSSEQIIIGRLVEESGILDYLRQGLKRINSKMSGENEKE